MKRLLYISIFMFALFLTGCDKTPPAEPVGPEKPVVTPDPEPEPPVSEALLQLTASTAALGSSTTAAGGSISDYNGDMFGIFISDQQISAGIYPQANNAKFRYEDGNLITEEELEILVTTDRSYYAYGYSPYKPIEDGGHTAVLFDFGDEVILPNAVGIINNISSGTKEVPLNFVHKTVQIQIIVKVEDDDKQEVLGAINGNSTIAINNGFYGSATLNLETGELTPSGEAIYGVSQKYATTNASGNYELKSDLISFFLPKDGQIGIDVMIKPTANDPYSYKIARLIENEESWVVGTSYIYTLVITQGQEAVEQSSSIVKWLTGDDRDVEIGG